MDLILPTAGTFLYMSYPWNSKTFTVVHNLALSCYSLWTFIQLSLVLVNHGFHFSTKYYFNIPEAKTIFFYFYISKYYEYMDTFILYGKGKSVSFLQKFHHIGAAFCWHLCYYNEVDAIIMASLFNSFIHSIMYFYYFLTIIQVDVRAYKLYLTSMQMLQFISGFASLYLWVPVETLTNQCIILIFLTYNLGLVFLFWDFMRVTYLRRIE